MFAQLFRISEEGNLYPVNEKVYIDDSLEGQLSTPQDCVWNYSSSDRASLVDSQVLVDFNSNF
jgi:hypothetical protein